MADYGTIKLTEVSSSGAFIDLYKEILSDPSWKGEPLLSMLDEWKNDSLFTLSVDETDAMFKRGACRSNEFIRGGHHFCSLPVILSLKRDSTDKSLFINFLWIHPRARGKGYSRILIDRMLADFDNEYDDDKIFVSHPVDDAKEFWSHMCCYPTENQYLWKLNVKEYLGV